MKPPTLTSRRGWQRFIAGIAIGAIISWILYFYMHGVMQEKQIMLIEAQKTEIEELKTKNAIWEKEYAAKNDEAEKKLTIQEVQVAITNGNSYKLNLLSIVEAQEEIRKDLNSLITKDIETVYKGKLLLKKTIENKIVEINDKKYTFEVKEILFYTKLYIEVHVKRY
ncbi:sporulation membrane protein YtrI [Bacillus massiliigorillae]|uniref:sporulation membrane protein YtrI n=1 Tax=Bacillus massiliigorillae TaxID=1243664 RepID=UPI0003A94534|nr:sporulation membrane protein YtrI [Bacillus massiliigorillae]